jgi:hypothetical protein
MLTEKEYCENQELLPIVAGSSSKAGGGIAGSAGRGPGAPAISGAAGAIFILIYLLYMSCMHTKFSIRVACMQLARSL